MFYSRVKVEDSFHKGTCVSSACRCFSLNKLKSGTFDFDYLTAWAYSCSHLLSFW